MTKPQYRLCWDDPLLDGAGLHRADCDKWQGHDLIASGDIAISQVVVTEYGGVPERPTANKEAHINCSQTYDSLLAAAKEANSADTSYTPCHCCSDEYLELAAKLKGHGQT